MKIEDRIFNNYCNELSIPIEERNRCKKLIMNTFGFQSHVLKTNKNPAEYYRVLIYDKQ